MPVPTVVKEFEVNNWSAGLSYAKQSLESFIAWWEQAGKMLSPLCIYFEEQNCSLCVMHDEDCFCSRGWDMLSQYIYDDTLTQDVAIQCSTAILNRIKMIETEE